jgi:hypothetical protein
MSKQDLIADAQARGITLTGDETVADLKKLLVDSGESANEIEKEAADEAKPVTEIHIYDDADQFVRTYSLEVHGENFAELAESYLAGHPKCHKA